MSHNSSCEGTKYNRHRRNWDEILNGWVVSKNNTEEIISWISRGYNGMANYMIKEYNRGREWWINFLWKLVTLNTVYAERCLQMKSELKANIWVRYKLTNLTLTHGFIMWRMAIHTGCWQHSTPTAPVNKASSHLSVYLTQQTSTCGSRPKSWQPSW